MGLFNLASVIDGEDCLVDILDGKGRIFNYFLNPNQDGNFLKYFIPKGKAQSGITKRNIGTVDYLRASIGVPFFSVKFVQVLQKHLSKEIAFHECFIECEGEEFQFFLAKTKLYIPIVDRENSLYRKLTDGTKVITRAKYREDAADEFFIARDDRFHERLVVSDRFKELVIGENLQIEFMEPV